MINFKLAASWLFRLAAAIIMVQSLFFKFSGADESVYIFSTLGMEPWGRIATGLAELIASLLLLVPRTTWAGAAVGASTMFGALFFHLTKLGIEVKGDGGQLFIYALVTLACCIGLMLIERQRIQQIVLSTFSKIKV